MLTFLGLNRRKATKTVKPQGSAIQLSQTTAWLLLISQELNLTMVGQELQFWMIGLLLLCLCWRGALVRKQHNNTPIKPQRWLVILLAIIGCIAIAINGKQLGLLLAMLHLMCLSYGLKALELNSRKDFYQLVILGIFILATSLIFNQSLLFTSIMAVFTIVNMALLLRYFSASEAIPNSLQSSGKMLLQSIPLALVLFVVFPRLEPFWQVPLAKSAQTGLSDQVTPGDIANLARSSELAFRVTFNNTPPKYSQLYWRALVLDRYDGKSWLRSKNSSSIKSLSAPTSRPFSPQVNGPYYSYQVIAQPSYKRWLFGLDIALLNPLIATSNQVIQQPDYSLQSKRVINQTLSYDLNSYYQAPLDKTLTAQQLELNLSYPVGSNPRLEQEAKRLRQEYSNDNDLVVAVLKRFRQQAYFYTLKPPLLINNSLDQFYFNTKSGFCVHYASSFAYLMRAAGIPARMVTGYMGGEYNPDGNYYSIYQYEAHAWTEIWLKDIGWQRIDPTAAVDPERVERGFSEQLTQEQSSLNNNFISLSNFKNSAMLNAIRLKLAAVDYQWTRWVIGYSSKKQNDLLSSWFGKMQPWKTGSLIGGTLIAVMLTLWFLQQQNTPTRPRSPWLKLYQQALTLLKKNGVEKSKAMPVNDFVLLVEQALPQTANHFRILTVFFTQLEYQSLSPKQQKAGIEAMQNRLNSIKKCL